MIRPHGHLGSCPDPVAVVERGVVTNYKPTSRTVLVVLASFLVMVVPAMGCAAMGYIWFVEHGLRVDTHPRPETILDSLLILLTVLPIIPVMLCAILLAAIPWMFVMARLLSWNDIQYFTTRKGPRLPWISDWLDKVWLRMI